MSCSILDVENTTHSYSLAGDCESSEYLARKLAHLELKTQDNAIKGLVGELWTVKINKIYTWSFSDYCGQPLDTLDIRNYTWSFSGHYQ